MFTKLYLLAVPVFLAIDFVWLSTMSKSFYQKKIGFLLSKNPNYIAAFIFYLLFAAGIVFFVVMPAIEKKSLLYALGAGALFGLISYATYDLTNLATVKDWPLDLTIIDLIWGSFVSAATSVAVYFISSKIF